MWMIGMFGLMPFSFFSWLWFNQTIVSIICGIVGISIIIIGLIKADPLKKEYDEKKVQEQRRINLEKIKKKKEQELEKQTRHPRYISTSVKREVWRRDQGRCVECESKELLEFDHIIPFSKGGSNTVRNIQLLCESCNKKKSNNI